jgi:hypothetical protein
LLVYIVQNNGKEDGEERGKGKEICL